MLKLIDFARREAAKPENQEQARRLARTLAQEVDRRCASRAASPSRR